MASNIGYAAGAGALCAVLLAALPACASGKQASQAPAGNGSAAPDASLDRLKAQVEAYRKQVDEQQRLVSRQSAILSGLQETLERQSAQIRALEAQQQAKAVPSRAVARVRTPSADTQATRYTEVADQTTSDTTHPGNDSGALRKPVGEAPKEAPRPQIQVLPELGGVLTPRGTLSLEPSIEFDHVSTNQLIFRGISIVQGLLIGVIDATDVRGDTAIGTLTARYGVTSRLELEAKIPYLYRDNRETDIPSTSNAHPFKTSINGHGLGDIELAAHYQFNAGHEDWPVFVGNLRYKTDSGTGPLDVPFDPSTGAPLALATGSGFNAIEPSLTVIYPSDPVVFFGSLEYDHSFARSINKVISQTCGPQNNQPCTVGEITPGDSYGVTLGMAISLNEMTSLSLGYQHYYIEGIRTNIGGLPAQSTALQVGSLLVGAAYQFGPDVGINFTTQIGATRDAPDVRVMLRVPIATHFLE